MENFNHPSFRVRLLVINQSLLMDNPMLERGVEKNKKHNIRDNSSSKHTKATA